MRVQTTLLSWCLIAPAVCGLSSVASAKSEEWQDTQGNKFRGEPAEVIGPVAFFRTGPVTSRRLPLHLLPPEECVRLNEQLRTHPARADDWAAAKGAMTQELAGNVLRLENNKLVPAVLKGRPEPEFYIVLYGSHGEDRAWQMIDDVLPAYDKFQHDYPGAVEALFYGTSDTAYDHVDMATSKKMPWLITDFHSQHAMTLISPFVPGSKYGIVVMNRDGVPLLSSPGDTKAAVQQAMDELGALLDTMRLENPRFWPDRLYYFMAVQPATFKQGHADPMLVGNPLLANGLRQRAVYSFDATIDVAADGSVTGATVSPGGDLPPKMAAPLGDALRKTVFVPAVDNGKFVAGVYHYHFAISR